MNIEQVKKILSRIAAYENQIQQLEEARFKLLEGGYSSVSVSAGGATKSYTRADATKITEAILTLERNIRALRRTLRLHSSGGSEIQTTAIVY